MAFSWRTIRKILAIVQAWADCSLCFSLHRWGCWHLWCWLYLLSHKQRKEPGFWPPNHCWTDMLWRGGTWPYSTTSTTLAQGKEALGLQGRPFSGFFDFPAGISLRETSSSSSHEWINKYTAGPYLRGGGHSYLSYENPIFHFFFFLSWKSFRMGKKQELWNRERKMGRHKIYDSEKNKIYDFVLPQGLQFPLPLFPLACTHFCCLFKFCSL